MLWNIKQTDIAIYNFVSLKFKNGGVFLSRELVSVKTDIEKKSYLKFIYIATFRRNLFLLLYMILISSFAGWILTKYMKLPDKAYSFLIFFLLLIISVGGTVLQIEHKNKKILKKSGHQLYGGFISIVFYDEKFKVKGSSEKKFTNINYSDVMQVIESKTMLIMFLNKSSAIYLSKKDIPKGQRDKVLSILKENIGRRYKKIWCVF